VKVKAGRTYLTRSGSLREVVDIREIRDSAPMVYWRISDSTVRPITGFTDLEIFESFCIAEQEHL
jgi:hypothetical protein